MEDIEKTNGDTQMKIGIFLDDERNIEDAFWMTYDESIQWLIVRTYKDFMMVIQTTKIEDCVISFDHDLQDFKECGGEWTGYDCVKFLVDFCMDKGFAIPKTYYHTQNPVGKENMKCYIENAKKYM